METFTRQQLVEVARSYVGTNFLWKGRNRAGVDCIGLLICVSEELGWPVMDDTSYTHNPDSLKLNKHLDRETNPAPISPIKHGQIAKFQQGRLPMHTGIITTDKGIITVINANMKKRVVVEQNLDPYWKPLLMGLREFKGVR